MLKIISKYRITFIVITALGVFLINGSKNWFHNNRTFSDLNQDRQTDPSVNCFKNLNDTLPDISTVRPESKRSIYFVETSCRSSTVGRITILPRQACAIESAAFNNPDSDVYVLYASRGGIKNEGSLSDYLLEILASYKNIKFLHFSIETLINGSIVESLYKENKVQSSVFPSIISSDVFRFLLLQKFGGFYLDLDVMVVKNLDNLPLNCIGMESNTSLNGAVLRVDNFDVGQNFTKLCLEELKNNFNGKKWGSTGPGIVTKVMKNLCGVKDILLMPKSNCSGFTVFPTDYFYPIRWQDGKKYFESQKSEDLLNQILNNSYVVHVWNKITGSCVATEAPNSIYNTLAKKFCPLVYKDTSKYF